MAAVQVWQSITRKDTQHLMMSMGCILQSVIKGNGFAWWLIMCLVSTMVLFTSANTFFQLSPGKVLQLPSFFRALCLFCAAAIDTSSSKSLNFSERRGARQCQFSWSEQSQWDLKTPETFTLFQTQRQEYVGEACFSGVWVTGATIYVMSNQGPLLGHPSVCWTR